MGWIRRTRKFEARGSLCGVGRTSGTARNTIPIYQIIIQDFIEILEANNCLCSRVSKSFLTEQLVVMLQRKFHCSSVLLESNN